MENNELLEELLNSYETDNYPDGFESKFITIVMTGFRYLSDGIPLNKGFFGSVIFLIWCVYESESYSISLTGIALFTAAWFSSPVMQIISPSVLLAFTAFIRSL